MDRRQLPAVLEKGLMAPRSKPNRVKDTSVLVRMTSEQKATLEAACDLLGVHNPYCRPPAVSNLLLRVTLEKAQEILLKPEPLKVI